VPQHYHTEAGEIDMEALLEHASGWGDVLLKAPGKERFAAIRSRLRESLREQDTPSAAKKYLTERLITTVGKSGKTSDLPKKLRDMIGNADAQREFVNDLQIGYAMLVPKMSRREARQVVETALDAAEEAGVPPETLESLRRMPASKVMAMAGPMATLTAGALLSRAPRDPNVRQTILMAAQLSQRGRRAGVRFPQLKALPAPPVTGPAEPVSFAGRAAPPTEIVPARPGGPIVPTTPQGPAAGGPGPPTGAGAAAAGAAGRRGIISRLAGALRSQWIPIIGTGLAALGVHTAVKGARRRRELGAAMRITGEVPEEYGGGYMVPTPEGGAISAGQFLAAMRERERQAKVARFNAVTQEMDLTRDVLSAVTAPDPNIEQLRAQQQGRRTQLPGRIRLGSARIPQAPQPRQTDDVMKQLDAILREAAGGT
jgi:hypothetical protein